MIKHGVYRPLTRSQSNVIEVRPFNSNEGELLKRTRLAALADSANAFSSSIEDERSLPDEYWSELVQGVGQFARSRSFLAKMAGNIVAMAGCYSETDQRYRLVAVWVEPNARGRGVGAALLGAVETWAKSQGASELVVAVFDTNPNAIAFYSRQGFRSSAAAHREGDNDEATELQLTKQLGHFETYK